MWIAAYTAYGSHGNPTCIQEALIVTQEESNVAHKG